MFWKLPFLLAQVSGGQTVSSQVAPGHVYSLAKGPQAPAGTLQTRVVPVASTQQALKQIQVPFYVDKFRI